MLITSKFHDYYDSASTYGIDKTIVYNRTRRELVDPDKIGIYSRDFTIKSGKGSGNWSTDYFLIGFCGNSFPCIRVTGKSFGVSVVLVDDYFYDMESLTNATAPYGADEYISNQYTVWRPHYHHGLWFDTEVPDDAFRKYNSPILVYHRNRNSNYILTVNPKLSDFKFMRMKDPHTAFQEIQQYLSGVLGSPEKETVTISDKDMAVSKGFDKWSFKKPPGKKVKWR